MKKRLQFLFSMIVILLISACEKNDNPSSNSITVSSVTTTASSASFRVNSYSYNGTDKTPALNGYRFTFASSKILTATNSEMTVTGNWSAGMDDSKVKLNIGFSSPSLFAELSEDWEVISLSDTKISLQHISGNTTRTDQLVFEKN